MNSSLDSLSRKVLQLATQEAQRLNSARIGTGHILLALARACDGFGGNGPIQFECDIESVRREVSSLVKPAKLAVFGRVPLNLASKKAIEHAKALAGDGTVSPIHLLIGILQDEDAVAVRVLVRFGLSLTELLNEAHAAIST